MGKTGREHTDKGSILDFLFRRRPYVLLQACRPPETSTVHVNFGQARRKQGGWVRWRTKLGWTDGACVAWEGLSLRRPHLPPRLLCRLAAGPCSAPAERMDTKSNCDFFPSLSSWLPTDAQNVRPLLKFWNKTLIPLEKMFLSLFRETLYFSIFLISL